MSSLTNQLVVTAMCLLLGTCGKYPSPTTMVTPQDIQVQVGQPVVMTVGQVIAIRPPIEGSAWQVDFADDILEVLMPPDKVQVPGADAWRFRAIAIGDCEVVITQVTRSTAGTPPPPPARFVFEVRVRRADLQPSHPTQGTL